MKTTNKQTEAATAIDWLCQSCTAAITAPGDHLTFIAIGSLVLIAGFMTLSRVLGLVLKAAVIGGAAPPYGTYSSGGLLSGAAIKVGVFIFIVGMVQGTFQPFVTEFLQVVGEVTA